jgi:hypothetical protein
MKDKQITSTNQFQDFATLSSYSQTTTKNESWVNVTVTRTDPDGSKSQKLTIAPKVKPNS